MATVLVVDDDRVHRDRIRKLLEASGHLVAAVSKSPDALSIVEHLHIDLVISELYMEDFDGIELLCVARSTIPGVPIVLMADPARTSYQPVSTVVSLLGAAGYLAKPIEPQFLEALLNSLLGGATTEEAAS